MLGTRLAMQVPHDIHAHSDQGHTQDTQQNLVAQKTTSFFILPSGLLQGGHALEEHIEAHRYEQGMEREERKRVQFHIRQDQKP